MNQSKQILAFDKILINLSEQAVSEEAKAHLLALEMILNEKQLKAKLKETTEARYLIDHLGMPPLSSMNGLKQMLAEIEIGTMLNIESFAELASFIKGVRQLRRYLERGSIYECELAAYGSGFYNIDELEEMIEGTIRNGEVISEASPMLKSLRRNIEIKKDQIKARLEKIIQSKKNYLADTYIATRGAHYVLAVKRAYKSQVEGSVLDTSRSGNALFIEPSAISKLQEELNQLAIEEENEVRRILYTLMDDVAAYQTEIKANMEMMLALDIAFAKGKLSAQMEGRAVTLSNKQKIVIKQGKHPLLLGGHCVPLDFEIGEEAKGIVITGPNTGGKTVALKTIGLLAMMVQCGLHVPVGEGSEFAMHNKILCDIGDGQSIEENLSTFSAHIVNVTKILSQITNETLVLLDELGSGTDPKEGMGIAIAILEALRQKAGLFVATTHYPEVKDYALNTPLVQNASMQFDKETLMPLYTLRIGETGESCALYIAEKLGFPKSLITLAKSYVGTAEEGREEALQEKQIKTKALNTDLQIKDTLDDLGNNKANNQKVIKEKIAKKPQKYFQIGDSVIIFPNKEKGIVFQGADEEGRVGVQIKGKKQWINKKRIKLLVPASELYPPDYDFSIIFDTVTNRKARKKMSKGYRPEMTATYTTQEEAMRTYQE